MFDDIFSRLDIRHEYDGNRQTNGRTNGRALGDSMTALTQASRGKNGMRLSLLSYDTTKLENDSVTATCIRLKN